MPDSLRRVHLIVQGEVQGVGFRAFTGQVASSLGICGWVRNLPDGNVEVEAEGRKEKIDQLVNLLRQGPRSAEVSDVEILEDAPVQEAKYFGFTVRF